MNMIIIKRLVVSILFIAGIMCGVKSCSLDACAPEPDGCYLDLISEYTDDLPDLNRF